MARMLRLSNDELYQMVKLYDILRDTDMIDELPIEIETVFDRLQSMEARNK
tara:strand:- start:340 stop:492 length:153 start_codon:yes stop_codon:yes gene_type:complete